MKKVLLVSLLSALVIMHLLIASANSSRSDQLVCQNTISDDSPLDNDKDVTQN